MKVMLEINTLAGSVKTGIATFVDRLCRALITYRSDEEFVLWGPDVKRDPLPDVPSKTFLGNQLISREVLESIWLTSSWGGIETDMDVYHLLFPSYMAPCKRKSTLKVATIYDLAFAYFPETIAVRRSFQTLANCIPEQAARADIITVISESCKQDLQTILGVRAEKIKVIYPGNDLIYPTEQQIAGSQLRLQALGVPENYLLCLGTWERRKNLPVLFRALERIYPRLVRDNIYLCMSGIKGWQYSEAEELVIQLGIADRIRTLGYVDRGLLPALYNRALLFVYPSMYEGFGLPVLEAMSCGTPVITTNVSSLPEVAGDAGLLFDPADDEALANLITRLLDDQALRLNLIERGLAQARKFSWEKAARETLAVYHTR